MRSKVGTTKPQIRWFFSDIARSINLLTYLPNSRTYDSRGIPEMYDRVYNILVPWNFIKRRVSNKLRPLEAIQSCQSTVHTL